MTHLIYWNAILMEVFMIIMYLYSVKPGMKVSTMTPLFLFHFGVIYMYIFHFVKSQENFNSRSKMAYLTLITTAIAQSSNI